MSKSPNIVFVFADQWRAQAFDFAGDPNARTPNMGDAPYFRWERERIEFMKKMECDHE